MRLQDAKSKAPCWNQSRAKTPETKPRPPAPVEPALKKEARLVRARLEETRRGTNI